MVDPPNTRRPASQPATKPWVMPSPEQLAVMAAVIDYNITYGRTKLGLFAPLVLYMPKEEEEALLAMVPHQVPPLRKLESVRLDASGDAFDRETGVAIELAEFKSVRIAPAPVPRPGQEATVYLQFSTPGSFAIWKFTLSNATGEWVVESRKMTVVS
jgi:hypothetical protein